MVVGRDKGVFALRWGEVREGGGEGMGLCGVRGRIICSKAPRWQSVCLVTSLPITTPQNYDLTYRRI
jgi:hypothetical protein